MDTSALPQRIRIRETPNGVTITIHNRMSWFAFWVNMVIITVLLSAGGLMTSYFINKWEDLYSKEHYFLAPLISGIVFIGFLITLTQNFLWLTAGREVFFIKNGQLSIQIFGIFISRKYEYAIERIKKYRLRKRPQSRYFRIDSEMSQFYPPAMLYSPAKRNVGSLLLHLEDLKEGSLAFDYEGESIELAHDLNEEEARAFYPVLLGYLKAEIKEGD